MYEKVEFCLLKSIWIIVPQISIQPDQYNLSSISQNEFKY